jgi:hypothetical protein
MLRTHAAVRGALLLGAATAVVSCNSDTHVVAPPIVDPLFTSYVALGNSITAGYQSGGINDSTQKQSYAVLLGRQMGTRFAYPSFAAPGCPPPINNLLNQTRVGGATSTATTCTERGAATATLNNVAVPGISTIDPVSPGGTPGAQNTNPLVQLILGGETMVQKALDNHPTFATVWIGNNDILAPALNGLPAGATGVVGPATTVPTFISNYAKDINALTAGAPGIKGVLIGVIQVAGAPIMFQAALLSTPAVAAAAAQVAGRAVVLDPTTCAPPNNQALVNFAYLVAIRSRPAAVPGVVFCQKVAGGGALDPGDNGILDVTEQATVASTINAYNAYIKAKADSIGFAYYDPNPLLNGLHANGSIPPFPNLASATAPFGQYVSLDGIHPAAASHLAVTNELITLINTTYKTSIPPITP